MDARADSEAGGSSVRDLLEEVFFAGIGAVALTKDRSDELVEELTRRGRLAPREAREVVDELTGRWRGEALRVGERTSSGVAGVMRELGLVTRREWEELELRLSQLEHRLRLVEAPPPAPPPAATPINRRRAT
jgi:polyhydroxyalkanoate synthesis regulator phasin